MALAWEERMKTFGLSYERIDYSFEKGGMLLKVNSLARSDTSLIRGELIANEKKEQEAVASAITQVDELLAKIETVKKTASQEKVEAQKANEELVHQLEANKAKLRKLS